jgi:catechol 2,3-dioxygenase-like lactoylglutathione lyase family enzyme
MITALHHIGLFVDDLPKALRFYEQAAGFAPCAAPGQVTYADTSSGIHWLRGPNAHLCLCEGHAAKHTAIRPVNQTGITHFCLQGHSMTRMHDAFATQGAHFHSQPIDLGTGWLYCYARDPFGNVVELEEARHAPHEQQPWIAHVAFASPDGARLAAFYHALCGGQRSPPLSVGPRPALDALSGLHDTRVTGTWITGLNVSVEIWQFTTPAPIAFDRDGLGYQWLGFEVDSLDATAAKIVQMGGALENRIDGILSAEDPDGNGLSFWEPGTDPARIGMLQDHDVIARMAQLRTQ